jgi:hypothetical protein
MQPKNFDKARCNLLEINTIAGSSSLRGGKKRPLHLHSNPRAANAPPAKSEKQKVSVVHVLRASKEQGAVQYLLEIDHRGLLSIDQWAEQVRCYETVAIEVRKIRSSAAPRQRINQPPIDGPDVQGFVRVEEMSQMRCKLEKCNSTRFGQSTTSKSTHPSTRPQMLPLK